MRSHGGGRLCYDLRASQKCEPCRASNRRSHTTYNRSQASRDAARRYARTARGALTRVRSNAKKRLG